MAGPVVPVVETARLRLRGWSARDEAPYAAMCVDVETMRFLGGPLDAGLAWRQMAMFVGHWALRGYGLWAVERRDDGAFLGRVGLFNPPDWPGVEVGWTLTPAARGRGYATEAGAGALAWAWAQLDVDRVLSIIDPANAPSLAVAGRLGLAPVGEIELLGGVRTLMGIDRPRG